ncbi:DUF1934 domain-containing protein [Psychrobacillus psychrodurans]|uniref:DUF1934 domain-containing protein n=1 Tax=Psychrobacillus psychrodurans TaxID=126157 RepID=UPI0008EA9EC5|nr:DUF1934 domain-containing protein [Psychrobacillus psychrodurans]MCZ8538938.1 DUF1934 domain-containing protein [Psychrobacillus psychrodurans]SFM25304.1 Uncharacterized beta-barrel protein YwiB, DUF1934 family [Psychrobacillus psychrodurans]
MSTPLQKTVNIRLVSTIRHPNVQEETINIEIKGTLILKGKQYYLVYEEMQDQKITRTTVKLGGQTALILRSGGVKMRLPFERGELQTGSYDTQYGTIIINTNTKHLHFDDGHFQVEYELIINEEVAGTYTLELIYTEAE